MSRGEQIAHSVIRRSLQVRDCVMTLIEGGQMPVMQILVRVSVCVRVSVQVSFLQVRMPLSPGKLSLGLLTMMPS